MVYINMSHEKKNYCSSSLLWIIEGVIIALATNLVLISLKNSSKYLLTQPNPLYLLSTKLECCKLFLKFLLSSNKVTLHEDRLEILRRYSPYWFHLHQISLIYTPLLVSFQSGLCKLPHIWMWIYERALIPTIV